MSKQNQFSELRCIFDKNRDVLKMLKAERGLALSQICFRAVYSKLGKKIAESKENTSMTAFTTVINGRYQVCKPDSITINWHNNENDDKLFEHTFPISKIKQASENNGGYEEATSLQGIGAQGLGAVEVNQLVEKRVSEMRTVEEHQRMKEDNVRMQQKLNELEQQKLDLEKDIAAKETTENYMRIIGMALPGLSKFFGGASMLSMLAGADETPKQLQKPKEKIDKDEREVMIQMLQEFMTTEMNEQEVATVYMLFMEFQKDKSQIQKILTHLTKV